MATIVFANCAVLDGASRQRREDHHVLVESDRIGEVSDRPIKSAAAETIDLDGRTLMPGLIDAHVHLARTEDLAILLALGVTTVRNMWGAPIHLEWRDRVRGAGRSSPSAPIEGPR